MAELPEELRALGRGMTVQAGADLPERVLAEIAATPPRAGRWRRWLIGLAALLAAFVVTVVVAAPVRAAIVHAFRFGGVEVRQERGPSPVPSPVLPGEHAADVAGASREVGFPVRVPAALGTPDSVTVADHRVATLLYRRPAGPIRIDEFAGDLGVLWDKYAQSGVATPTTVDGHQALWFDGPITIVYVGADGTELPETARETSNTLVWTDGALTVRIDGLRTLADALVVATSMS